MRNKRAAEILRHYSDAKLNLVDALIVATAERLNITRILILDHPRLSIDPFKALR